ncbi:peptidoglycan DD-metalloendopeptidase family protein [Candidatus Foliamicus sp.]
MKSPLARCRLGSLCVSLAGSLFLAGCWGWIPEDPAPAEPVPAAPEPVSAAIETSPAKPSPASTASDVTPDPVPETYVVVAGDTLFSIAWRYRLKVGDLAAWNKLGDGSLILVGQRLRLAPPAGQPAQQASSDAATSSTASRSTSEKPQAAASSGTSRQSSDGSTERQAPKPTGRASPDSAARPAASGKWRWPAEGRVDARGARVRAGDYGVRIMGQQGQNVHAADSGKVMYAGDGLKAYGLLVIVQHSPEWLTAYGHNEKILVKEGDEVQAGQSIATMGIGPANTAMLHFEIRRNGKPIEPINLLPPRN